MFGFKKRNRRPQLSGKHIGGTRRFRSILIESLELRRMFAAGTSFSSSPNVESGDALRSRSVLQDLELQLADDSYFVQAQKSPEFLPKDLITTTALGSLQSYQQPTARDTLLSAVNHIDPSLNPTPKFTSTIDAAFAESANWRPLITTLGLGGTIGHSQLSGAKTQLDAANTQSLQVLDSLSNIIVGEKPDIGNSQVLASGSTSLNYLDHNVAAADTFSNWVCDVNGLTVRGSLSTADNAEGEDDENGSGNVTLPVSLPEVSVPQLVFPTVSNSYNTFNMSSMQSTGRDIGLQGVYTPSTTTIPDRNAPGTNWVHIVDRTWIDANHWSFTETLVLNFDLSNSSNSSAGGFGFTHNGFALLTFSASQGLVTDALAGPKWSLSIDYLETLGFTFSAAGSSSLSPAGLVTTLSTAASDQAAVPDPTSLPATYSGTSSWSSRFGVNFILSGNFTISSTPQFVVGLNPSGALETLLERQFSTNGTSSGYMTANIGADWAMSSSSGSLTTNPMAMSSAVGWPTATGSPVVPTNGALDIDIDAADSALQTSPDTFQPYPNIEGTGHALGASGGLSNNTRSGGQTAWDFSGATRNDRLERLSGDIGSDLADIVGDDYEDNRVYVFQNKVETNEGGVVSKMKAFVAYGYNLSPKERQKASASIDLGLSATPDGLVAAQRLHDFADGDMDLDGQSFSFTAVSVESEQDVNTPFLTGKFIDANVSGTVTISKQGGEMNVSASETTPVGGTGTANWKNRSFKTNTERYDHDFVSNRPVNLNEPEPSAQLQDDDEVYFGTSTNMNSSVGDLTLTLNSDLTVSESGMAGDRSKTTAESSLRQIYDGWLKIYYEEGNPNFWQMDSGNHDINERMTHSVEYGVDYNPTASQPYTFIVPTTTGNAEPQVTGSVFHQFTTSGGSSSSSSGAPSRGDLLDFLSGQITSDPIFGAITSLTTPLLEPMVRETLGDEFLLTTSGEALVGFTVGAAAITVLSGAIAGGGIGCSLTATMATGAAAGGIEYLGVHALANIINPAAKDPTLGGLAQSMATGAVSAGVLQLGGKWLGLVGCFVAGTPVFLSAIAGPDKFATELWQDDWWSTPDYLVETNCEVQSVIAPRTVVTPIECVALGSRVQSENPRPWDKDSSLPEPVENDTLLLSMTLLRVDGEETEIELLRPKTWIDAYGLSAGVEIPLKIEELGLGGIAKIKGVEACPEIADGEGSVVTGRFITRRVEATVRVELEGHDGLSDTLEGTAVHPVWSLDRDDWVPLGELLQGEQVSGIDGPVTVTSLSVKDRPIAVYNLEVHGEHVYRVSKLGILVHNACSPSKILGRAMAGGDEALAASISAAGNQAAHVVPVRGFSRRAADVVKACNDARAILNRPGIKIDINDAWNGF